MSMIRRFQDLQEQCVISPARECRGKLSHLIRSATQRDAIALVIVLFLFSISGLAQAPAAASTPGYLDPLPQDTGDAGLKLQLRKLQTTGRLMMVVAHPDDEDGATLTLEARGKGVQALLM